MSLYGDWVARYHPPQVTAASLLHHAAPGDKAKALHHLGVVYGLLGEHTVSRDRAQTLRLEREIERRLRLLRSWCVYLPASYREARWFLAEFLRSQHNEG